MSTVIPPALKPGATIAFISPSLRLNHVFPAAIARAKKALEDRGYNVCIFYEKDSDGIQASIDNRVTEIRAAFLDASISAVICTIGGSSFTELLPRLIADEELGCAIRDNPKIVVGMSDNTGLHWFLNGVGGLRTFYGPSAIPELGTADALDGDKTPRSLCFSHLFNLITKTEALGDILQPIAYAPKHPQFFDNPDSLDIQEVVPAPALQWLRPGKGQGRLFGGSVTVAARLNGMRHITPNWKGRMLFFETAEGPDDLDNIRIAVADLIAQGVFEEAAGLVIGRPIGFDTEEQQGQYIKIFKELLCEGTLGKAKNQFPILFNVDFGHTTPMVTLPYDALAELDSEADRFTILEAGVQ